MFERFKRSYREAVFDMFVFQSLEEIREQIREMAEGIQRRAMGAVTYAVCS